MGMILALACAITWALSIIPYRFAGSKVDPLGLNVYKNTVASTLMVSTWWIFESKSIDKWWALTDDNLILFASGFIGIGVADSLYLAGLKRIGAARVAVMDCAYLPAVVLMSYFWLNQHISLIQLAGIAIVLGAIFAINMEHTLNKVEGNTVWLGSLMVAIGVSLTALAITGCKPALARESLLFATSYRLVAGMLSSYLILFLMPNRKKILLSPIRAGNPWILAAAAVIGTYITMLLWIGGFKFEKASIAAVLNQTSSFFLVIFAATLLKEQVSRQKALATVAASLGVLMVSFG